MSKDNNRCSVVINGAEFVRKDSIAKAEELDGMPYQIVRTYSAGVFAGYVESRNGKEGVLRHSRRLWYWDGAAALDQLAIDGTSKPDNCKFTVIVDKREVTEIIECLQCTEKSKQSIQAVKVWKM